MAEEMGLDVSAIEVDIRDQQGAVDAEWASRAEAEQAQGNQLREAEYEMMREAGFDPSNPADQVEYQIQRGIAQEKELQRMRKFGFDPSSSVDQREYYMKRSLAQARYNQQCDQYVNATPEKGTFRSALNRELGIANLSAAEHQNTSGDSTESSGYFDFSLVPWGDVGGTIADEVGIVYAEHRYVF